MKRFFACLLLVTAAAAFAGSIRSTITFDPSQVSFGRYGDYDVIALDGAVSLADVGKPALPLVQYLVLIPPTAEITGVRVLDAEYVDLPGRFMPIPAQPARPLSIPGDHPFVKPDPLIYGSLDSYPGRIVDWHAGGSMAGFRIGGIAVTPVEFVPASRLLRLCRSLEVEVTYEEGRRSSAIVTRHQYRTMAPLVKQCIINPEAVETWHPDLREDRADDVDMVVISSNALLANWNAFSSWKNKKGVITELVSTEYIYANYPGSDNPARIRAFIRDYVENKGLTAVLLGGDSEVIPPRYTHLWIEESTIVDDIPTDLYYADLDWSWDGNGNGVYGEMGDTVDLLQDVLVGRAPVDNATHIAVFTHKDTMFEKHPDTTALRKLLLPSEMLFPPWHGEHINDLIAECFSDMGWQVSKCVDPGYGAILDSLNHGFQFCHSSTHGSVNTISVFSDSDIPAMTNGTKYDIMTAISCMPGYFDYPGYECLAESLLNYPAGGCVAAWLNARYGLGYPPAMGPSDMLDLGFFRSVAQGVPTLGAATAVAKNAIRDLAVAQAPIRWCDFCLTLFGDPTLPVWRMAPRTMTVTHAAAISGGPQAYRISVTVGGVPLEDALVCVQKGTEVHARGATNSQGWIDLAIVPSTTGSMSITVTAPDCRPYEGSCTVGTANAGPCLVFASCQIDDAAGNGDGRIDPGETVSATITIRNDGTTSATGVVGVLRTLTNGISILDSTAGFGTIPAGDSAGGDAFRITAAPGMSPGTNTEYYVRATAAEGAWDPFFELMVGVAPEPRYAWADHDVGTCVLSVTTSGSVGVTAPYGEGSGFKYHTDASYGTLFYGSMLAGTGPTYVADRFYAHPATQINEDFVVVDSLRRSSTPLLADQEYAAVYADSGHASPRGLEVRQWSLSVADEGYDDWVILCYDYWNKGSATISGLYSGLMMDFDVYNDPDNIVRSDTLRRFTYMMRSLSEPDPTVGVRLLEPPVARNLAAIDHQLYVEPAAMMTEAVKDSFLNGTINMRNSDRQDNWSACVSAGPFTVTPGDKIRVVYAIVGGDNENAAKVNSDSAQSWWDIHSYGVTEGTVDPAAEASIRCVPNPFSGEALLSVSGAGGGSTSIVLYDASGRLVRTLHKGPLREDQRFRLSGQTLPAGVYFVAVERSGRREVGKLIRTK